MLRFIVRRLLVTIPTILVVITITWALIKLAPGTQEARQAKQLIQLVKASAAAQPSG